MKKFISVVATVLMCISFVNGQTVSLGISNPTGSVVRIFVTANSPGFVSDLVTGVQFTIRWHDGTSSMGSTITNINGFNMVKSGSEKINSGFKYQQFVMNNNPTLALPAGTQIAIMEISMTGGSGNGLVELAEEGWVSFNEPYFEFNLIPVLDGTSPFNPQFVDNVALPVELTSFSAMSKGRNVVLNWKTATEINSSSFEVERNDGKTWTKVSDVKASGTSNAPKEYSYVDMIKSAVSRNISYRLKMIDNDGKYEYSKIAELKIVPTVYSLEQNYPNPFNPETKIQYSLPMDAKVSLKVYDMVGREVASVVNEQQAAGYYEQKFGGYNLSSGVYFYCIVAESGGKVAFTSIKKMVMIK